MDEKDDIGNSKRSELQASSGNSTVSTLNTVNYSQLPPPPTFDPSGSLPTRGTKINTNHPDIPLPSLPPPPIAHEVLEVIPDLESAPNSGHAPNGLFSTPIDSYVTRSSANLDTNAGDINSRAKIKPDDSFCEQESGSGIGFKNIKDGPSYSDAIENCERYDEEREREQGQGQRKKNEAMQKNHMSHMVTTQTIQNKPIVGPSISATIASLPSTNSHIAKENEQHKRTPDHVLSEQPSNIRNDLPKSRQINPKRIISHASNPPLQILSPHQSHIPILLLPTITSQSLAQKNHLSLSHMFSAMANSLTWNGDRGSSYDNTKVLGRLAPFRSIGRSLVLNWEFIRLQFFELQDFERDLISDIPPQTNKNESLGSNKDGKSLREKQEQILTCSMEVWDNDLLTPNSSMSVSNLENKVKALVVNCNDNLDKEGKEDKMSTDNFLYKSESTNNTNINSFNNKNTIHEEEKNLIHQAHDIISPHTAPHLLRFRSTLDHITSLLPHDMLQAPPLCLIVASSSETSSLDGKNNKYHALDCLNELAQGSHHLPSQFQNGLLDKSMIGMRREFILLHDEVDGPINFDETAMLKEMQRRFGGGCCAILRINSCKSTDNIINEDLKEDPVWDSCIPSSHKPTSQSHMKQEELRLRGLCLSDKDKLAIRRYMAQMITLGLLPAMERRISNLNVTVTNAKKGMKNVLKSFWRKPKDGVNNISNLSGHGSKNPIAYGTNNSNMAPSTQVIYRYDTIESQTRLLADTLFLLRDYDSALGIYRLVKDDYKHDDNLHHLASVHEMMALCLHLLDPYGNRNGRDVIQNIETSLYLYTRAAEKEKAEEDSNAISSSRPLVAPSATRCATRLCLLLSSTRTLCQDSDMQIADFLASASSSETPLGAAVLLEQSSSHYYRAGMYRKFSFHILMAGHMFRSAHLEKHAFRCFTSAMHVYVGNAGTDDEYGQGKWNELYNHIMSALAAQLYSLGRMGLSLYLYTKLVGKSGEGRVSLRSQQKFINHILEISRNHHDDALNGVKRMKLYHYDSNRNSLTEKILQCTPHLERVLEIPFIDLPLIIDSSVRVEAKDSSSIVDKDLGKQIPTIGTYAKGSDSVWQDMMCSVQAELRAASLFESLHPLSISSPTALSMERMIDLTIKEIDKEKSNKSVMLKNKKSATQASSPSVRTRMEPISLTFTISNPLSMDITVTDIQLVANIRCSTTDRVCTNQEAIGINSLPSVTGNKQNKKKWKFNCSCEVFEVPDFAFISPTDEQNAGIKKDYAAAQYWASAHDSNIHPFFVVTKEKRDIGQGAKVSITLGICPLVNGDLDILGVRCKIFNELWVYHPFKMLGQFCHDTPFNRANRIRAKSFSLNFKIEHNMPNIIVDIVPREAVGEYPVLQGQLNKWTLNIKNIGTAPASNITLKTNVPWINIITSDNDRGKDNISEFSATSRCIGPSGTLMSLKDSILSPGESIKVPIHVRISGGGSQEFYMLFRYELAVDVLSAPIKTSINTPSNNYRWLRKMISVAVYPSLTMTASLTPSFWNKQNVLSIEITNYRSDRHTDLGIKLDKICFASRYYSVKPFVGKYLSCLKDSPVYSPLEVGWQEQITLHYLVTPMTENEDLYTLSKYHVMNNSSFSTESSSKDDSFLTDFLCLEHAHEQFTRILKEHQRELALIEAEKEEGTHPRSISQIRKTNRDSNNQVESSESHSDGLVTDRTYNNGNHRSYHPTSIASLCPPIDINSKINVICSWGTTENQDNQTIVGRHHLRHLVVQPELKSKGCPLTMTSKYKTNICHDFSLTPLYLDLEITIFNRLVRTNVDFEFIMNQQHGIEFVGSECFQLTLTGGEEHSIPLTIILNSSGVYNLQNVKLIIKSNGCKVPYVFPSQWLVKVNM